MFTAKDIVARRVNRNINIPIVLFFILTIGNYSFLRYSVDGSENVPLIFKWVSHIRLLLPVWVVSYCFLSNFRLTSGMIRDNYDVAALGVSWFVSCLLSMDATSYLLYGLWSLSSLVAVLLFVTYNAVISGSRQSFLLRIMDILWIGNFVILLLDVSSMLLIKPKGGMYPIFFTSNTFWAYPTMIMGILALLKMRFSTDHLVEKVYYAGIFLIALAAVYFSARRSPLFALLTTSFLLYLPLRLPQLLLIGVIAFFSYTFIASSAGTNIVQSLPESYMKYRIERMSGLVKGRRETSYSERQKIWQIYLERFYSKPVMGEGLAAAKPSTENKKYEGFSAHNTFVGSLTETGLLGALLLLVVLGRSLLKLKKIDSKNGLKIYIILFIPTLLINWVEYNLIPGQIFFLYSVSIWLLPRGLDYQEKVI